MENNNRQRSRNRSMVDRRDFFLRQTGQAGFLLRAQMKRRKQMMRRRQMMREKQQKQKQLKEKKRTVLPDVLQTYTTQNGKNITGREEFSAFKDTTPATVPQNILTIYRDNFGDTPAAECYIYNAFADGTEDPSVGRIVGYANSEEISFQIVNTSAVEVRLKIDGLEMTGGQKTWDIKINDKVIDSPVDNNEGAISHWWEDGRNNDEHTDALGPSAPEIIYLAKGINLVSVRLWNREGNLGYLKLVIDESDKEVLGARPVEPANNLTLPDVLQTYTTQNGENITGRTEWSAFRDTTPATVPQNILTIYRDNFGDTPASECYIYNAFADGTEDPSVGRIVGYANSKEISFQIVSEVGNVRLKIDGLEMTGGHKYWNIKINDKVIDSPVDNTEGAISHWWEDGHTDELGPLGPETIYLEAGINLVSVRLLNSTGAPAGLGYLKLVIDESDKEDLGARPAEAAPAGTTTEPVNNLTSEQLEDLKKNINDILEYANAIKVILDGTTFT